MNQYPDQPEPTTEPAPLAPGTDSTVGTDVVEAQDRWVDRWADDGEDDWDQGDASYYDAEDDSWS